MELTTEESKVAHYALTLYRKQVKDTIDRQRDLIARPEPYRSEYARMTDRTVLEKFYEIFANIDSAIEKTKLVK